VRKLGNNFVYLKLKENIRTSLRMAFNFPEFSILRNARNLSVQVVVIITSNSSLIQCESNQRCWNHIKFWAHKNPICRHRVESTVFHCDKPKLSSRWE